jgi:hypothetical protein
VNAKFIFRSLTSVTLEQNQKPPLIYTSGAAFRYSNFSGFRYDRDHVFEQDLKCHGMTATQVGNKKLAVTLKDAVIESYFVGIVIANKCELKLFELEPVPFFSIALGFLNLADQPIVHDLSPFHKMQKGTRVDACLSAVELVILGR